MANAAGAKVVTRFAPSPTGFLHIGGGRTALFAQCRLGTRKHRRCLDHHLHRADDEKNGRGRH
jgi:glutamyl/glutaminyl-tRNA synthetase